MMQKLYTAASLPHWRQIIKLGQQQRCSCCCRSGTHHFPASQGGRPQSQWGHMSCGHALHSIHHRVFALQAEIDKVHATMYLNTSMLLCTAVARAQHSQARVVPVGLVGGTLQRDGVVNRAAAAAYRPTVLQCTMSFTAAYYS